MKAIDISKEDKILVIAPHPDDECIGPGGVLLMFAEQCEVVVLTDGRQGQGDLSPKEGKEVRKREFVSEMNKLGIKSYKMLDIEDGTLLSHTDCLIDIDISKYSIVFVTGLQDDHPDHKAAFLALQNRIKQGVNGAIPRCFIYEVHTPLQHPSHFIDITNLLKQKEELVRIHDSQLRELPYDRLVGCCAEYRATLFRMPQKKIEVYEEVDLRKGSDGSISETEMLLQKERVIGWTLKRWVRKLLDHKSQAAWFEDNNIHELYVYGYGELGKLLVSELLNAGIKVKAVIDRRAEQFSGEGVDVIHLEDAKGAYPIIVTAVYEYDEIEKILKEKGYEKVFSLKEIIENV